MILMRRLSKNLLSSFQQWRLRPLLKVRLAHHPFRPPKPALLMLRLAQLKENRSLLRLAQQLLRLAQQPRTTRMQVAAVLLRLAQHGAFASVARAISQLVLV